MASFKLKNDCVDDNNEPAHKYAIFDNSHVCNAAIEHLIRLPTDKCHTDNENHVTFYDAIGDGSAICKSQQNYARVTNSCETDVNQCNNSLRYRNCVDCKNFFVTNNHKNSSNSVNQSPRGLPQICGSTSTIDNNIEIKNTNILNNLPDVDAELNYNNLFCMPSDYYYNHSSINNLLC